MVSFVEDPPQNKGDGTPVSDVPDQAKNSNKKIEAKEENKETKPGSAEKKGLSQKKYGWFRCEDCVTEWGSPDAYSNQYQECDDCDKKIYPYKLALTPYQGPYKRFGMFQCDKCETNWSSANSWANCYQRCNKCNGKIYPYVQYPLRRGNGSSEGRPAHPTDKCQKCIELGRSCVSYGSEKQDGEESSNKREE